MYDAGARYKTYREWRLLGRQVICRSRPHGWTWNNYALYTIDQTQTLTNKALA